MSFNEILKGNLTGNYSCVICSFAFHLIPKKDNYMLTRELLCYTKQLIIISPTKKCELQKYNEFKLAFEDYVMTGKRKKVYLKMVLKR